MSIDRGSWVVAAEMSLEDGPPTSSFQNHALPSETELPFTKLVDGRWMDIFLSRLSDIDSLNEKKKKLSYKKTSGSAADNAAADKPAAKAKSKGKGKGKQPSPPAAEGEAAAASAGN